MSKGNRLDAPAGLLLQRDRPIRFEFEGRSYVGYAGDTLSSALLANGQWLQSRSFKYHRPRGPLSMAGQDANTLVQVGGEPNVLADQLPLRPGLVAYGQNYLGSLQRDGGALLGLLSRFMPVGFYYRAFFRPRGIWEFWEKSIRRMAGLGRLDLNEQSGYCDKSYHFYDVVVVGAGPAGLSAAAVAAEGGASVLLVDEGAAAGGALCYHRFDVAGERAERIRAALLARVTGSGRVDLMLEATCNGWFADNYLPVIQGSRLHKVRARQCIVAAGTFEQHVVFRNNDLPGVMMTSAAERLMKLYAVRPGRRAVVLTGNDDAYLAALDMHLFGVQVQAVIDMRAGPDDEALAEALRQRDIALITRSTVYEARGGAGKRHLSAVDVRAITGRGEVAAAGQTLDCDLLCMSGGYMPAWQLPCQAGGRLSYDDEKSQFTLQALPQHLHVAGSANGLYDLDAVLADGDYAGRRALAALGLAEEPVAPESGSARGNYEWPVFPHPAGGEFVDYDEDLQLKDIVNAVRMGYRDVQLVKRFSTVGMGPSQGRHSALPTAQLVAQSTGRSVTETGVTTARPPFGPEKLALLAGRHFNPLRRTAMHYRHVDAGACMMTAGNWRRPAFYGPKTERAQCLQREALAVRKGVGMIDISTLGGIDLYGPDSAEFMNRMYTFAFLKQPVGKTRYAVMTNEQGVVIDDGVACRFDEEHFYVSATTTGVDRVYREMLRWNAQWRLNVDIVNVTSAYAAINLAGPLSRSVLELLCADVQLDSAAFPYLACRQGTVADIPARLLRVGFVGELGYEIHVPASQGEALWDELARAGEAFGLRPFGVETQRLLRLEKGHIIVGQDTDGMSHPRELSLQWAVNTKKPFYIGKRSVAYLDQAPQRRTLVGFTLPAGSPQPLEGHLVLQGERISGNVTSCEFSPTLQCIIGLAYVAPEQADEGSRFPIRVDGGEIVQAQVCALPFYDSDNKRQEL